MVRLQLIIYGVIIILLISGVFTIKNLVAENKRLSEDIEGVKTLYESEVEYYKNKAGRETAKFQSAVLSLKQSNEMRESEALAFVRQFEGVRNNLKNLEMAYQTLTEAVGSIETNLYDTTIVNIDSSLVKAKKFFHKTEYLEANGLVFDTVLSLNYSVKVPIDGVVYWQRQHWKLFGKRRRWLPRFWGKRIYTTELSSPNPNVRILGGQNIMVKKK